MTRLRPLLLLVVALALGMFADEIGGRQRAEAAFPGDNGELGPLPAGAGMPVVIDNFDDNSLSETAWTPSHMSGTGASMAETNGRVEFHIESDAREGSTPTPGDVLNTVSSGITHNCVLAGDFDIYFDFSMAEWPEENGVRIQFQMAGIGVQRGWDSIFGNFYSTGSHIGAVATTDTSGRLRLARSGTMATASFDAGGSWQTIGSADVGDGLKGFFIRAFSHDHLLDARPEESQDKDITVTIDNLTLAGGTLTCGEKVEFTQAIQVLQTVPDLLEDLKDDGEPPVPIVAGKPASARVYLKPGSAEEQYSVTLNGAANITLTQTLPTNCTQENQRRQEDDCASWDFSFTPPAGEWTLYVRVRDRNDQLLSSAELKFKSVETQSLFIVPVSVCDTIVTAGPPTLWGCGDVNQLVSFLPYLRKMFPFARIEPATGGPDKVYFDTFINAQNWWGNLLIDRLQAEWTARGSIENAYFYGAVRREAGGGATSASGAAYLDTHAGASKTSVFRTAMTLGTRDAAEETMAHELGHAFGREHVPHGAQAGLGRPCYAVPDAFLDAGWPYGTSPLIQEVGFDVNEGKAILPEDNADTMSYCTPRWITPYTFNGILSRFKTDPSPASVQSQPQSPSWLISGVIDAAAELQPVFQFDQASNADPGSGDHRIEIRDEGGAVLFTRFFQPKHGHAEGEELAATFVELVPVQQGAERIVVLGPGDEELGSVELGGTIPVVDVEYHEAAGGTPPYVSWMVTDADSSEHTYWVQYSADGGATWKTLAPGYQLNSLALDFDGLPGGDDSLVRVLASDGGNTGLGTSEPFNVPKKAPQAEVIFPGGGSAFDVGDLIWLQAYATDAENGYLDGAALTWTSSRDGSLGTGDELHVYDLSEGVHTITLTVRDSDDNEATDSITVVVGEGGLKGDVDCDGDVDAVDAQKTLQHVAGLPVAQGPGCPAIGSGGPPFGDVDCDDDVDAVDALSVLRHVAALPVNLPPGCPEIGARRRRRSGSDDQRRAIGVRRGLTVPAHGIDVGIAKWT